MEIELVSKVWHESGKIGQKEGDKILEWLATRGS